MKQWKIAVALTSLFLSSLTVSPVSLAASTPDELVEICTGLFGGIFEVSNNEPLGRCQWNLPLINAIDMSATGKGVTVGMIDTGVDLSHPDIEPNLDVDRSCSFIFDDTPTADPREIANGDCSNNTAVQDLNGHGTHTASTLAAPLNGIGIVGVAPEATIVALKVCTTGGFCFVDSIAAALRYAGDQGLDIVNVSLIEPYLCKSEAEQRATLKELEAAARYAQQRGVLIVAASGTGRSELQHPHLDPLSPTTRYVRNNCRVTPAELPGVMTVSATGPIGYPGYHLWLADESSVGMSRVDVTAPGGDYFRATGTVQDAVLGAMTSTSDSGLWDRSEARNEIYPGLTVIDHGARYFFLNGTSMASSHAAGVAALAKQMHPDWDPAAIKAAVQRTAQHLDCPPDWQPLDSTDERERCYGNNGRTSFFGHGMIDAKAAARE